MDEFVNPTIIGKWMDDFTKTPFDKIIASEHQTISKIEQAEDETSSSDEKIETSSNEINQTEDNQV